MIDLQHKDVGKGSLEFGGSNTKLRSFLNKTSIFISESSKGIGRYMLGKMITSAIIFILAFVIFRLLEVNPAIILAVILGVTNLVPLFGPWVGLLICAMIVVFINPIHALYTTITALLLQIAEQFFLLPLIVGKSIDIKPLLIFLVLFAGSLVFGFWGVLLAVPAAVVIKIAYEVFIRKQEK
jgi:predicted PurR-regulated permease PerM